MSRKYRTFITRVFYNMIYEIPKSKTMYAQMQT